jgi:hypothetical protein
MAEYGKAYAQVEPLTIIYDQKLQQYNDLYRIAEQRDRNRSLFNATRVSSPGECAHRECVNSRGHSKFGRTSKLSHIQ